MNITWKITHAGGPFASVILFSNLRRLRESIRSTGKAVFSVSRHSRTSLSIEIGSSDPSCHDVFAVAHIPKGADGLSFVKQCTTSFFDGERHERHYLRLSMKQGLPELKRYLAAVLAEVVPGMEDVEAELVIHDIPELCAA